MAGSMCIHCGEGIPFKRAFFSCTKCRHQICNACHNDHPRSHRGFMHKAKEVSIDSDADPDEKDCTNCMQAVEARAQCNECDLVICWNCWEDALDHVAAHEHKNFTYIQIPGSHMLDDFTLRCASCETGSTLSHCSRCLEGIKESERFFECRHCHRQYGGCSPSVCVKCLPDVKAAHNPKHEFVTMVYNQSTRVDENAFSFRCLDCRETLPDLSSGTIWRHKHLRFQLAIGKAMKETIAHQAYRKCPRRPVKGDGKSPELHDDATGCKCCWELFERNAEVYACTDCNWDFMACSQCEERGIVNHRHQMICLKLRKTVPPENFWEELVNPTKSRGCDICKESFRPDVSDYLQCPTCKNFDICRGCMFSKTDIPAILRNHKGGNGRCRIAANIVPVYYFDCGTISEEWLTKQVDLAKAFIAEHGGQQEAEEQPAARARSQDGNRADELRQLDARLEQRVAQLNRANREAQNQRALDMQQQNLMIQQQVLANGMNSLVNTTANSWTMLNASLFNMWN